MPITRHLIRVGNSAAVTIPSSWIKNIEREIGQKLTAVALDVSNTITIYPIFEKKTNTERPQT